MIEARPPREDAHEIEIKFVMQQELRRLNTWKMSSDGNMTGVTWPAVYMPQIVFHVFPQDPPNRFQCVLAVIEAEEPINNIMLVNVKSYIPVKTRGNPFGLLSHIIPSTPVGCNCEGEKSN